MLSLLLLSLLLLLLLLVVTGRQRFVYVVSDACMSSQLVTLRVLQRLEVRGLSLQQLPGHWGRAAHH
jgi:hypothetical protein